MFFRFAKFFFWLSILNQFFLSFCALECVQLGFLPKNYAKWVAPLSDSGIFVFSAYIFPREVLRAALEGSSSKVQLILHVSQVFICDTLLNYSVELNFHVSSKVILRSYRCRVHPFQILQRLLALDMFLQSAH